MTAAQERVQQVSPAPALVVDVYGAMQMLRLGRSSILNLADRGELTRLHFGRAVRYSTEEIEALVQRRRAAGRAERETAASSAGLFRLTPPDPDLAAWLAGGDQE